MGGTNLYNIVCICDEAYVQHAAVMLHSLFKTNESKTFKIYLLTEGISNVSIKRMCQVVGEGNLHIINVDLNRISALTSRTKHKSWSPIMYVKLLIPDYLPSDVDRVLFLDVDLVVNTDISSLYNLKLDGNIIAACEDYLYCGCNKKRLGLSDSDLYINSGVMIMNIRAWRDKIQKESMIDFLYSVQNVIENDQDAFALYFKDEITLLPTNQWNATTFFFERKPRILLKYVNELECVRKEPYIIHFCEPVKPWYRECKHPYRYLYEKHLRETPWSKCKFESCGTVYGKPAWIYTLKYWLNVLGSRNDDMAMIRDIL